MEQVIMNLALQYAKSRGLNAITDKAIDYAYETLGIENEEDYTEGGIYGMRNAFSPANLGRTALKNFATKALTGGSGSGITGALPVFGAALGLGYMTNPLREGSYNYNPNLQGQINYASGRGYIGKNPSSGLMQYGPSSILSGQNVVSGFGTNDYGKQLQNYKDKYGDTMSQERLDQLNKEIEDLTTNDFDEVDAFIEKQTTNNSGGGGGDNNYGGATQSGGFDPGGFEQDGTGRQGYGRGGIASL